MAVRADRGRHSVSVRALLADSAVPDRPSSDCQILHHLDEALAEALVVCRNMREPPTSQVHASLPPHLDRGITRVDCDGDAEIPRARQRMHVQMMKSIDKGIHEIL